MQKALSLLTVLWLCSGCAAGLVALRDKDLSVSTHMSETVFLDPAPAAQRTVWLRLTSTADQPLDLSAVREGLAARGYRIVDDADAAHYRIQAHTLFVGKTDVAAIDQALGAGFGGPLAGVLGGGLIGAAVGGNGSSALLGAGIGGLVAGGAELVAGALVKTVHFSVVTDIQISERVRGPVAESHTASLSQGSQTQVQQVVDESSQWKKYRTRVVATAKKTNLKFEDAKPELERGLATSLAGLL